MGHIRAFAILDLILVTHLIRIGFPVRLFSLILPFTGLCIPCIPCIPCIMEVLIPLFLPPLLKNI